MEKQSFLTKEKHKSYMQRVKETDPEKYEELKKAQARRSKAYRASLTGEKKQRENELSALRWKRFAEQNKETDPEKYEELKKERARRKKAYRASLTGEKKRREKELGALRWKRFAQRKKESKDIQLKQGVGSDTAPQVRLDEEKLQGKKQIEAEEVISESEREIKQQTEHVQYLSIEAECDNEDFTKTTMQRERKALADEQSQELQDDFMDSVNEAVARVENEKQLSAKQERKKELIDYMIEETNSIASAYDDMKQETLENYSLEKITDARLKEKLTTRVQRHSITWIEHNMMNWQRKLHNNLQRNTPHEREIIMILDPVGGTGKSQLARHMERAYPNDVLKMRYGKTNDMLHYASKFIGDPKIVFIDLTRQQQDSVNWQGIEDLKNGDSESFKYQGIKVQWLNPPHMVIFANFAPKLKVISPDRWSIYKFSVKNPWIGLQLTKLPIAEDAINSYVDDADNNTQIAAYNKRASHSSDASESNTWFD
jgi:hypothetical protein